LGSYAIPVPPETTPFVQQHLCNAVRAPRSLPRDSKLITSVTIVDAEERTPHPDGMLMIEGDVVKTICQNDESSVPERSREKAAYISSGNNMSGTCSAKLFANAKAELEGCSPAPVEGLREST
jgi:hypothetical protein